MRRAQPVAAVLVTVLLVGGAAYADRELEPKAPGAGTAPSAESGAWFCPHGGGERNWEVFLQVANPGDRAATIRIRTLGHGRPTDPQTMVVDPGAFVRVPVPAQGRERASMVEWFDQWVAVGWIAHAGGDEGGVAAEPCAPAAGERWLLPDGTTETDANDDVVIVMNPFSRDAVFSITLLSDREPVVFGELTDVVLGPRRSRAIRLNDVVKGERTVSTLVEASVGRVVAGTLGIVTSGGIRSSLGYLGAPPADLTFIGGADAGRTDLVVMNAGLERTAIDGRILGEDAEQPVAGLADSAPPPQSGRTYTATTSGPSSIALATQGGALAAARRTFGVVSDQGSTEGAAPSASWVILPVVVGSPSHPGLVLANPGSEPAVVTLSYLGEESTQTVTLTVPPGRTLAVPEDFLQIAPESPVVAVASSGTVVAGAASYSLGREGFATYAVAVGIPIPA